jgi:hypothetical protein
MGNLFEKFNCCFHSLCVSSPLDARSRPTTELSTEWVRGNSIGSARGAYIRLYVGTGPPHRCPLTLRGNGRTPVLSWRCAYVPPSPPLGSRRQRRRPATIVRGHRATEPAPRSARSSGRSSCMAASCAPRRCRMGQGVVAFGWTPSATAWTACTKMQGNLTKRHGVPTHTWSGASNATARPRLCRGVVYTKKSSDAFVSRLHPNTESVSA